MKRLATVFGAVTVLLATVDAQALPRSGTGPTCYCPVQKQVCVFHAGSVKGALPGDLVFKKDAATTGIAGVMKALGLNYTHVGMMMDSATVRHNTVGLQSYVQNLGGVSGWDGAGYFFGGLVGTGGLKIGDVYINPSVLASATVTTQSPGNQTFTAGLQSAALVSMADPDDPGGAGSIFNYFWPSQVTLVPARDEQTNRQRAIVAALRLLQSSAGYGVYAYSQLDAALAENGSTMCAGSIYEAWKLAETGAGGFREVLYSAQDIGGVRGRASLASSLWNALIPTVLQQTKNVNNSHGGLLSASDEQNAAEGVTNQVVNAFAYGGNFQNTGSADWSVGSVGTGLTVSPDDLYRQIQGNGTAYAPMPVAGQDVTVTRDYYTCSYQTVSAVCACGTSGSPGAQ